MKVTHTPPRSNQDEKQRKGTPLSAPLHEPQIESPEAISDEARLFQKTKELVKKAPETRPEKVAALKKKVAEGTYKADAAKVADALVDEHAATDFGKNNL